MNTKINNENRQKPVIKNKLVHDNQVNQNVASIAPYIFAMEKIPDFMGPADNGKIVRFLWQGEGMNTVALDVSKLGYDVTLSTGLLINFALTTNGNVMEQLNTALDVLYKREGYGELLKDFPRTN